MKNKVREEKIYFIPEGRMKKIEVDKDFKPVRKKGLSIEIENKYRDKAKEIRESGEPEFIKRFKSLELLKQYAMGISNPTEIVVPRGIEG